ncbi:SDR family oxidoreductase [Vampirovibrio sp.]|uniref:SDR family oxidoreductase n=1 Tax=Vampirovibrio sp. TaxID=2717857 RepID=UPI00359415BE
MSEVLAQFQLKEELAVVTGGFGKLGAIWTQTLLEAGAVVAVLDRPGVTPSGSQQALQTRFGASILRFYEADVTDKASLKNVRGQIESDFNRLAGILINNAGIDQPPQAGKTAYLQDIPAEAFARVLEVNITGAFLCMQVFGGAMLKRGGGAIVNIGSLYASVSPDARFYDHLSSDAEPPFIKPPAYGASKAALVNLTRYFATHWGPQGIRVNALSPGGVEGGQDAAFQQKFNHRVPLGRMANAADLSGPFLFLASKASQYVTGIELKVDGGFTAW